MILDSGPMVAFFVQPEAHHPWAVEQFQRLRVPFYTCEPVITEICFLLERKGVDSRRFLRQVATRQIDIRFDLRAELASAIDLMSRYRDTPMSLADACLVRMSESLEDCPVLTTDGHFRVYRRNGRQVIPTIMPER